MHTGCWCEGLRAKDDAVVPGMDRKIMLKWMYLEM